MKHKTIGFVSLGLTVSGGTHIVLRWAQILARAGHRVYVIFPGARELQTFPFLEGEAPLFFAIEPHDARSVAFDVLFATWWRTLLELPRYQAKTYAFLAQALEAQFYANDEPEPAEYRALVTSGVSVVTIAHWLRDYFVEHFGFSADAIPVVLNPIDKQLWRPTEPLVPRGNAVRFLVEGRHTEARKHVVRTMRLLDKVGAEYIWVGAETDRARAGRGCVSVLSQVAYSEMPKVYASCDVLVKLSDSEGMFGPPLEMFATGGTAIAWDVPGAEEYMTHRYNALLAPMHSDEAVLRAVTELRDDRAELARLKKNALATAATWPDWQSVAAEVEAAVTGLPQNPAPRLDARVQQLAIDRRDSRFPPDEMEVALARVSRALQMVGTGRRLFAKLRGVR